MELEWNARKQTFTADSLAYADLKGDLIPRHELLEWLLERSMNIKVCEDNTATIQAADDLYSGQLRHLARHNRINIGWRAESFAREGNTFRYSDSASHKAT